MKKKIVAFILVVTLIVSSFVPAAFAEEGAQSVDTNTTQVTETDNSIDKTTEAEPVTENKSENDEDEKTPEEGKSATTENNENDLLGNLPLPSMLGVSLGASYDPMTVEANHLKLKVNCYDYNQSGNVFVPGMPMNLVLYICNGFPNTQQTIQTVYADENGIAYFDVDFDSLLTIYGFTNSIATWGRQSDGYIKFEVGPAKPYDIVTNDPNVYNTRIRNVINQSEAVNSVGIRSYVSGDKGFEYDNLFVYYDLAKTNGAKAYYEQYAKNSGNVTVTFDTSQVKNKSDFENKTIASGGTVTEPSATPIYSADESKTFLYWADKNTYKKFDFTTKIYNNITLVPIWDGVYNEDLEAGYLKVVVNVYDRAYGTSNVPVAGAEMSFNAINGEADNLSSDVVLGSNVTDSNGKMVIKIPYDTASGMTVDGINLDRYIGDQANFATDPGPDWYNFFQKTYAYRKGHRFAMDIVDDEHYSWPEKTSANKGLIYNCTNGYYGGKLVQYNELYSDSFIHNPNNYKSNGLVFFFVCYVNKSNQAVVTFDTSNVKNASASDFKNQVLEPGAKATKPTTIPIYKYDESRKFMYWTYNGEEYDFNTPVTDNITLVPKWERNENAKGIITIHTRLWDHQKYVDSGGNAEAARTTIPIRDLKMDANVYKTEDYRTGQPFELLSSICNLSDSRITTDSTTGDITITLDASELSKLKAGTVIDVNNDVKDKGTYNRGTSGSVDETVNFSWDWKNVGEGVAGVRVISSYDNVIIPSYNTNNVAELTQSSVEDGFSFEVYCYVVPAVTVEFDSNGGTPDYPTQHIRPVDSIPWHQQEFKAKDPGSPTKEGYKFAGWHEVNAATGDVDPEPFDFNRIITQSTKLKALYAEKTYTVLWKNDDGTVLEKDEGYVVGNTPKYDGKTPTKASTAQYDYTFSSWYPEVSVITSSSPDEIVYTATYTSTVRKYTVTWKNYDGTVLETDTGVEYGKTPTYDSATPTKPEDNIYTYSFSGWSPAVGAITGDTTYTAQYNKTPKTYTITYDPNGGSLSGSSTQNYNGANSVTLQSAATLENHTFTGWKVEADSGNWTKDTVYSAGQEVSAGQYGDVTLVAQYKENEATFTYSVVGPSGCGSVSPTSETVKVSSGTAGGSTATASGVGYKFIGWYDNAECSGSALTTDAKYTPQKPLGGVYESAAYYAKFEVNYADYTVEHYLQNLDNDSYTKDGDATETKQGIVGQNTEATAKTYSGFTAQTIQQQTIEQSGTVVKVYYNRNKHDVKYSYTGTVPSGAPSAPSTVAYKYGATVTVKSDPSMTGYTFSGWTNPTVTTSSFTMPDSDVEFTGQWTAKTDATYTVHYYIKDTTTSLADDKVVTGATYGQEYTENAATVTGYTPDAGTKQVTAGYATDNPKPEITFYYTINSHTATAATATGDQGISGTTGTGTYNYNADVTFGATVKSGYDFDGWYDSGSTKVSGDISYSFKMPDNDVTYNAKTTEQKATFNYNVKGPAGSGSVSLETETVGRATGTATGSTATAATNYKFVGWYSDEACTQLICSTAAFVPSKTDGLYPEGTTNYYALFDYDISSLTIKKTGMKAGETAIFTIKKVEGSTATAIMDVPVTFSGDGSASVTVKGLTIGTYQIVEKDDWTWRYTAACDHIDGKITLDADATKNVVEFTNTVSNNKWLSGASFAISAIKTGIAQIISHAEQN